MSLTNEFRPTIGALVELEHHNTTRGLTDEERDQWVQHTRRLFGFDQHERRRFFRLHTPLVAQVSIIGSTETTEADITQLSAGGFGLYAPHLARLVIGDVIELSFGEQSHSLSNQRANAKIVWVSSKAGALGAEFVDIQPAMRAAVIEYLGAHLHLLLTRAEDAFKLFFQHSLDLAALLEGDGRIITISETGAAAFGSTAADLVGRNFETLVASPDARTFAEACERAQLGGRTRMRIDLIDADSGRIAVDLAITPFRIEDLRLGCFLAGYDDRERQEAEDEIGRLERRLIVSDAMATLGYISAGIVHDVNNPLTFILMHADALQELATSLKQSRDVTELRELLPEIAGDISIGAQRIADLISELRRFTSLATGESQHGDIASVVASVTVMVRNLINHRARFEQSHDPTVGSVTLSSGRLTQILLNLLTNATQAFSDSDVERNVIRLDTRRDGDNVVIEVVDNGPGIPAEQRAELVEPFKTTRAESGGTGLGLSIAKDCAESVGGTLTIDDAVGGGTHVTVTLPAYDDLAKRAAESQKLRITLDRSPRVLIVDDEVPILNAYERALKSQFEVVTTTSPAEALMLATRQDYDVLVCDVMIPGISGLDFYDQLATESPELVRRVIFVTGGTMSSAERGRLAALGNRVILKPVSATALADAMWEIVAANEKA